MIRKPSILDDLEEPLHYTLCYANRAVPWLNGIVCRRGSAMVPLD